MSITAGVRVDHQKIYYNDAIRKPEIADIAPSGPIFPTQTTVTGATLVGNTDIAPVTVVCVGKIGPDGAMSAISGLRMASL